MTVLEGRKVKADNMARIYLSAPILEMQRSEARLPMKDYAIYSKFYPPILIFCSGVNN